MIIVDFNTRNSVAKLQGVLFNKQVDNLPSVFLFKAFRSVLLEPICWGKFILWGGPRQRKKPKMNCRRGDVDFTSHIFSPTSISQFPASRGLSRRGKMPRRERERETSASREISQMLLVHFGSDSIKSFYKQLIQDIFLTLVVLTFESKLTISSHVIFLTCFTFFAYFLEFVLQAIDDFFF